MKLLHLVAFAEEVAEGRIGFRDPFSLASWDLNHLPGTDGGARARSFDALGIRHEGERAADPQGSVPAVQLAKAMIGFSDNSAADCLHDLLGPSRIVRIGARYGWPEADLRSVLGELLLLVTDAPLEGVGPAERRRLGDELRQRYATDESFRVRAAHRVPVAAAPTAYERQAHWAAGGPAATARQIADLMTTVARGAVRAEEPKQLAQRFLEMQTPRLGVPGLVGSGAKDGIFPGILSTAVNTRWSDGRTGVAVAVVSRLSQAGYATAARSGPLSGPLRRALVDERWARGLAAAVTEVKDTESPVAGRSDEVGDVYR